MGLQGWLRLSGMEPKLSDSGVNSGMLRRQHTVQNYISSSAEAC